MNIKTCSLVFTGRIINKPSVPPRKSTLIRLLKRDTFVRATFDVNKDLKKVRLKEKINEGRTAEVYTTNFDDYVVRLVHGMKFKPKELTAVDDSMDLVVAEDEYGFVQLMKYVKGEPLYGKGWNITETMPKEAYMKEFERICALPDETFAEYMREIIKIRRNGYDIDEINPNNFLLDGKHIRIVDIEKKQECPTIFIRDFDALVNRYQLVRILKNMTQKELYTFSDAIQNFYDRLIDIALCYDGQLINIPKINDDGYAKRANLIDYLYYKNWPMIKTLMDRG